MKRIIAFLLAFVLTGACLPITPAIAEEGVTYIGSGAFGNCSRLQLLQEMLQQYEAVKNWNIHNLLRKENL